MCSNFEAIRKNRAFLLDLPESDQLEFPEDIFPNYPLPLIFSNVGCTAFLFRPHLTQSFDINCVSICFLPNTLLQVGIDL